MYFYFYLLKIILVFSKEWICIVCGGDCAKERDVCVRCEAERTRSGRSGRKHSKVRGIHCRLSIVYVYYWEMMIAFLVLFKIFRLIMWTYIAPRVCAHWGHSIMWGTPHCNTVANCSCLDLSIRPRYSLLERTRLSREWVGLHQS